MDGMGIGTFFRHVVVVMTRRCHHHRSLAAHRGGNSQHYGESWSVRHLGKAVTFSFERIQVMNWYVSYMGNQGMVV